MEELSTAPIIGSIRAEDQGHARSYAAPRRSEKRPRSQGPETENHDLDEPAENGEPEHHVDISV